MPLPGQRRTYFVPANFDNPPPPDGPIKLGQLVVQPENPGRPVDPAGPLAFEDFEGMKRYTNSTKFSLQDQNEMASEGGLFGRALQAVSVKLGASFSSSAVSYVLNEIETLDVEFIEPTDDYVKASMDRPRVKAALKKQFFKKRLYMVTGIKTAYPGAKLDRKDAFSASLAGESEASGPKGTGAVGGNAKFSASELRALALVPARPFVYGYRLQECYYRIRSLNHKEFVDGALFGVNKQSMSDKEVEVREEDIDIEFNFIDDKDLCDLEAEDDEAEFEIVSLVDEHDGSSCDVIVPIAA
ncbi:hypothetical protein TEQG_03445 [Trichophyton equinum CBS 127.97]|uniref:Uncharacterized protein n=1 Tax=Trichophyton equinum (strain ATCC MYA-4606 / CBS 127.97) TaxID=559882 RepID=F2PRQ6_TRIEC|nr:hypothetical protein TEQG_03445 [Trichophyton equinum CBS 127.97]